VELLRRSFIVPIAIVIISLQFVACTRTTNKSTQTASDTSSDDTGTTLGFGEEEYSDDSSLLNSSSNSGNVSNLFNSDLDDQEVNQSSQLTSTSLTSSTQSCLSNGSNSVFYDDEYQGTGLNNAGSCLASSSEPVAAQEFYDTSLKALNSQEICIARAMMVGPQSEADAAQAHMRGRMEMLRCFRELAGGMRDAIPWSGEQVGVYNNYIQNMNRMVYRSKNGQF